MPNVLIACVGNIFLGDDAFGVEVARQFASRALPEGVHVRDFGIRGYDLAYALTEEWDLVILVDAVPRGGEPGTIYVIEIDPSQAEREGSGAPVDAHALDPVSVLRLVRMLGGSAKPMLVVGCEPSQAADEEPESMELSPPVRAAVAEAVGVIEELIQRHTEPVPLPAQK